VLHIRVLSGSVMAAAKVIDSDGVIRNEHAGWSTSANHRYGASLVPWSAVMVTGRRNPYQILANNRSDCL